MYINSSKRRLVTLALAGALLLSATVLGANAPVQAAAAPVVASQPAAAKPVSHPVVLKGLPGERAVNRPLKALASSSILLNLNYTDFGTDGVTISIHMEAINLRGYPLSLYVFFAWEDDTLMPASASAPYANTTSDGSLYWSTSATPHYNDSDWASITAFIPNSYFPPVSSTQNAYLIAAAKVDGYSSIYTSDRKYFHINP